MRLDDFLTTSAAEFFYIGAVGGSGFFAMGAKTEIMDEIRYQERKAEIKAEEKMNRANLDSREVAEAMAKVYKGRLDKIDSEIKSLRRQRLSARSTTVKKEIRDRINTLNYRRKYNASRYESACLKAEQYKNKAVKVRKEAVYRQPFTEREVLDTYKTIAHEPAGIIVLVSGKEQAGYWDYQEYERGKKR